MASIPLANILYEAGIISKNVSIATFFGFPLITLVGGVSAITFGIPALSNHFEKKKDDGIKELMELNEQKENNFDRTTPKTKSKIEKEIKEYTNVKNDQIMTKVNFFASIAKANQLIKEIIFGLMLLNSNNSIETIYEKLPKNITVMEALIYFSPKGEELKNVLPKLDSDIATQLNIMNSVYTTLYLTLHK